MRPAEERRVLVVSQCAGDCAGGGGEESVEESIY